jgi:hypothetical protein
MFLRSNILHSKISQQVKMCFKMRKVVSSTPFSTWEAANASFGLLCAVKLYIHTYCRGGHEGVRGYDEATVSLSNVPEHRTRKLKLFLFNAPLHHSLEAGWRSLDRVNPDGISRSWTSSGQGRASSSQGTQVTGLIRLQCT